MSPCSFAAASLYPLEELDLLAGGQRDDRLAPVGGVAGDAPALGPAALLLALARQHVDGDAGHLLLAAQLLDGGLDLDLVRVGVHGERVLPAPGLVDRLLGDHGPE